MTKFRLAVVSAIALAGALGVGAAQARDPDVRWSVTIGSPTPVYGYPAVPVYQVPSYGYHQPAPHYQHYPRYPRYGEPTRWDRDGDGIPNRRDRLYNPRWDRDGDGIPNRYERRYHHYGERDHDRDGVPNRWDRYDDNPPAPLIAAV